MANSHNALRQSLKREINLEKEQMHCTLIKSAQRTGINMNIEMLSGISIVLVQSLGFVGDFKSIHLITLVSHHDNDKLEREVKT